MVAGGEEMLFAGARIEPTKSGDAYALEAGALLQEAQPLVERLPGDFVFTN
jgi:hypothetical protein